jgi:putative ABC transport system permease protein
VHIGVPVEKMLVMTIGLSPREYQQAYLSSVYQEIVESVQRVPGVVSVALGWNSALASGTHERWIWVEGRPFQEEQLAGFNVVSPGFFSTAGIPVLKGHEFSDRDVLGAPKVVVINEAFAKRYFPEQDPVGRHFGDQGEKSILKYEVIGVVADSRNMFLKLKPGPVFYLPLLQDERAGSVVLHVRTRGNPRLMLDRVRSEIRALNPHVPVYDVATLSEWLSLAQRPDRMMAILASFFWLAGAAPDGDGNLRSDCLCGGTPEEGDRSAHGIGRNAAERSGDDCARDTDACCGRSDIGPAAGVCLYARA